MKTLLFISIDPSEEYDFSYALDEDGGLTEAYKEKLALEYGFNKEKLKHDGFIFSSPPNGERLYGEMISDDKVAFDNLINILNRADITSREDLKTFLNANFPHVEQAEDFPDGVWLTREDIATHIEKTF